MNRVLIAAVCLSLLVVSEFVSAQRVKQQGRAIVEFTSPQVKAVAAYEFSRRNHTSQWLLIELAVQAHERIAIERVQINLRSAEGAIVPIATHQQFLDGRATISQLLQNARISRHDLRAYFDVGLQPTIRFFSYPRRVVHDSFVSNLDEVATGDLLFKTDDNAWRSGTYRLVISHPEAMADMPIVLE